MIEMKKAALVPAADWVPFGGGGARDGGNRFWISEAAVDPAWDGFLQGTPLGQFQQASAWGRVKRLEGWTATRFLVTRGEAILAGCQILWKAKHGLRIGYVSKGPVLAEMTGFGASDAVALVQRATRHLRLAAVVVQPPDFGENLAGPMGEAGFAEHRLQAVISANLFVDIRRPLPEIEADIVRSTRTEIRKTRAGGVTVRRGGEDDSALFFELMSQSCQRQGTKPNPSSASLVQALVREFNRTAGSPSKEEAVLLLAEFQGQVVAAELLIRFGDRLTAWKKGWIGSGVGLHPTKLIDLEAIKWGNSSGCGSFDFAGVDRSTVISLLEKDPKGRAAMKSTDFYKTLFGGTPVLLPEAKVWISNAGLRTIYRVLGRGLKWYADARAS